MDFSLPFVSDEEKKRQGRIVIVLAVVGLLLILGTALYNAMPGYPEPDEKLIAELKTAERGDFLVRESGLVFRVVQNVGDGLNLSTLDGSPFALNVWAYDFVASRMSDIRVIKFPSCEWINLAAQSQGIDLVRVTEWQKSCQ